MGNTMHIYYICLIKLDMEEIRGRWYSLRF